MCALCRECDSALREIQSVRHLTEVATLPINDDSYFGSLEKVSERETGRESDVGASVRSLTFLSF